MFTHAITRGLFGEPLSAALLLALFVHTPAQSTTTLQGRIVDPKGAVVPGVKVTVRSHDTGIERSAQTDSDGAYQVAALPAGAYRVEVRSTGFQTLVMDRLDIEVGRILAQDFRLSVGDISQEISVISGANQIERASISVGQVIDQRTVQEIPLNGRYFLDLGLLVPGSVTPPQSGSAAIPVRGAGSFAFNTAGNREEAVNYIINGISLNHPGFSSINFQPSISSVQEFKVDTSTFSAEYGQNSGAVVNIATRSGANEFHGELFEFLRNGALDARNFFEFNSSEPPPFKRNMFGVQFGGPLVKNRTFFFFSYEGLRHRQGLTLNSLALSDAERASATDPIITRLIELIPRANFIDSSGAPRFVSSAIAPVNLDQWTMDISHNLSEKDQLHGYYAFNRRDFLEPSRGSGATVPGFGSSHFSSRHFLSLNYTRAFGSDAVNDARFGF